jgi:hypothetical protein
MKLIKAPAILATGSAAVLVACLTGFTSAHASGSFSCSTSATSGNCGPYRATQITLSNGFNTYVGNNMWGCGNGNCGPQRTSANGPGDWQTVSNQANGNTAVLTYPEVAQVFTNTSNVDPLVSSFKAIRSDFAENMHVNRNTDAEAAYDVWLDSAPHEVMIWVDNKNRGNGGARKVGSATIYGQNFTIYKNGSDETIVSLNGNEQAGRVHILATLRYLTKKGFLPQGERVGQVDFGWEICSTGGVPETFTVSHYTLFSPRR